MKKLLLISDCSTSHICGVTRKQNEIMKNIDYFFELLRSSSGEKSNFLTPKYQDFFVDLLDNLSLCDDLVRLSFLEFENSKVASSLSFVTLGSLLSAQGASPAVCPPYLSFPRSRIVKGPINRREARIRVFRDPSRCILLSYSRGLGAIPATHPASRIRLSCCSRVLRWFLPTVKSVLALTCLKRLFFVGFVFF